MIAMFCLVALSVIVLVLLVLYSLGKKANKARVEKEDFAADPKAHLKMNYFAEEMNGKDLGELPDLEDVPEEEVEPAGEGADARMSPGEGAAVDAVSASGASAPGAADALPSAPPLTVASPRTGDGSDAVQEAGGASKGKASPAPVTGWRDYLTSFFSVDDSTDSTEMEGAREARDAAGSQAVQRRTNYRRSPFKGKQPAHDVAFDPLPAAVSPILTPSSPRSGAALGFVQALGPQASVAPLSPLTPRSAREEEDAMTPRASKSASGLAASGSTAGTNAHASSTASASAAANPTPHATPPLGPASAPHSHGKAPPSPSSPLRDTPALLSKNPSDAPPTLLATQLGSPRGK